MASELSTTSTATVPPNNNQPSDNGASVVDTAQPLTLAEILRSPAILLDRMEWFQLLQDNGTEMTAAEKKSYHR